MKKFTGVFSKMKRDNLKILFVASECTPIAKVGGLGDVIGALPKALTELGLDVRIVIPKYRIIDENKYNFKLIASKIKKKEEFINIYQGFLPDSKVPVYLLENEKYFGENGVYSHISSFDGIERFLFFSETILDIFSYIKWFPQIIHCHDWETAIIPLLLKLKGEKKIRTLLTIHNLAIQGKWNSQDVFRFLNLKRSGIETLQFRDKDKDFNILQQGILNADLLNTVSSTYRKEIITKKYGKGLEIFLRQRKNSLLGILNGIDFVRFNPETDLDIKENYSLINFEKKNRNKIELQKIFKLPEKKNALLFSFIGRLDPQKGIDLVIKIMPNLVKSDCQLVILGKGGEEYEKELQELAKKYPKNISVYIKFDPVLAQKIYAGSDIFLMPSKFEPCGLGQMIAMRYGAIPIVRETGGLADTVIQRKTGFLFKQYNSRALLKIINEALKVYKNKKEWLKIIKRAMKENFSWKMSAKEYLSLYKKLLNV